MIGLTVEPLVHRFVAAAARLSGDEWLAVRKQNLRGHRSRPKELGEAVVARTSAAEWVMLDKFVRDSLIDAIWAVAPETRQSSVLDLAKKSARMLQKRDKVGMEVARPWLEVFEGTPVVLDEIVVDAA